MKQKDKMKIQLPSEICVKKMWGLLTEGKENKSSWKESKENEIKVDQTEHKIQR